MKKEREILYYENYFIDFFMSLEDGAKKKTQKTPDSEIEKALKLKNEYYASKP